MTTRGLTCRKNPYSVAKPLRSAWTLEPRPTEGWLDLIRAVGGSPQSRAGQGFSSTNVGYSAQCRHCILSLFLTKSSKCSVGPTSERCPSAKGLIICQWSQMNVGLTCVPSRNSLTSLSRSLPVLLTHRYHQEFCEFLQFPRQRRWFQGRFTSRTFTSSSTMLISWKGG